MLVASVLLLHLIADGSEMYSQIALKPCTGSRSKPAHNLWAVG